MSVSAIIAFLVFLFSLIPSKWKGLTVLGVIVVIGGLIGMVVVAVMALSAQFDQEQDDDVDSVDGVSGDEIPEEYIPVYEEAGAEYSVPPALLAAIHRVETVFSEGDEEDMVSYAGAEGHMQFMPCTWVGWNHPSCSGLGAGDIPENELIDLDVIDEHDGFAVDGSGTGDADPYDIDDAVHSAANYLAEQGAADGNLEEAVYAYNGADWYVDDVMDFMDQYSDDGGDGIDPGDGDIPEVVEVGEEWIGDSEYVFGGGRNEVEQAQGIFDCSSFVHWAFQQIGIQLGPLSSVTTDSLANEGESVDSYDKEPGDLVFFDTYKTDGHVGIYAGDGQFIGAQSSDGVEYESLEDGYWGETYNGNVQRIG
ncbi:NlpC/P60 family protein [Natribacillus halophilus]|uniref:NlpC/P60 family protein n=1 Tax=Natribacillus halophilus TaxID=549003 RepID=A0A1G8KJB0_9BACI|nr:bifunctional lytic transglycosylase/C40 family peptidase [Natribacillus halophilus]SDI43484.1 NlpC/P60 family protein [Natribacillus halophilus]